MSREAFTAPTIINPPTGGGAGGGANPGATSGATSGALGEQTKPVRYRCGECNSSVPLRRQDIVRCHECGHRVLYKERTSRMVQFEAR